MARGLIFALAALFFVALGAGVAHFLHDRQESGAGASPGPGPAPIARALEAPSKLPTVPVAGAVPDEDDPAEGGDDDPLPRGGVDPGAMPDPAVPPDELQRPDVLAAMEKVRPRVQSCFDLYNQPGLATVKLSVVSTGRVTLARVAGPFEGTETGACIEAAAKAAQFRPFKRPLVLLSYSFALKPATAE